jgi:hypothetical protein
MSSPLPSSVSAAINLGDLQKNVVRIRGPLALISLAGLVWGGANLFSSLYDLAPCGFCESSDGREDSKGDEVGDTDRPAGADRDCGHG